MAIFKCKMCGGDLEIQDGLTVCECEYCGLRVFNTDGTGVRPALWINLES